MNRFLKRLLYKVRHLAYNCVTRYLQWRGYLGEDLEPLKCPYCGCCVIEECNHDVGGFNIPDGCVTEFDARCTNCKRILGHWAYGNWDV